MRRILTIMIVAMSIFSCADNDESNISLGPGEGAVGVGGSTARFVIKGDYLYIVTDVELKVLKLTTGQKPQLVSEIPTTRGLETIFNLGNYLFLGAEDGVYIYNLINPANPSFITRYVHQLACDPVIAQGSFAYLTLRDGTDCRGTGTNQLITLDISDINSIVAVDTINMLRPRGLTIFEGDLYVSEGAFGTKKFDISTPYRPHQDTLYDHIPSNDLIGLSDVLIVTENRGVSQFNSINDTLTLLSQIR
ncbi:MAG: hypothetical protein JXR10_02665 [Cyclobacteriaceae bacterium]